MDASSRRPVLRPGEEGFDVLASPPRADAMALDLGENYKCSMWSARLHPAGFLLVLQAVLQSWKERRVEVIYISTGVVWWTPGRW